jgi:IPT/TIG domain
MARLPRKMWLTLDPFRALALYLPASIVLATGPPAMATGSGNFNGISVKVFTSDAPPDSTIQLTAALTEPAPILTAVSVLSISDPSSALGPVLGAALFGPGGSSSEVAGTAIAQDGQVTIRTTSPSAEFGTDATVPILTVTRAVRPDAPLGAEGTVAVDPAQSLWIDPSGRPYTQFAESGGFKVAGTMTITDVLPGHGVVPAGSTVTVRGIGFQPGARVDVDDVNVASTEFVSDTELRATISQSADMYGHKVKVKNPDLALASHYAYLRTSSLAPSSRPLLAATYPIFSPKTYSSAVFTNAAAAGEFLGLALQNPGDGPASVTVELGSAAGAIASTELMLPPKTRISRDVSELFAGAVAPADGSLVVRSSAPVQMLGLIGDDPAGSVAPLAPALASP